MSSEPREKDKDTENKNVSKRVVCKYCEGENLIKWGKQRGHQRYRCNDCDHVFDDNGRLPRMRKESELIAHALNLYFEGLSLRKLERLLPKLFRMSVANRNILRWIEKFEGPVREFLKNFVPRLSGHWEADETMMPIEGGYKWFWEGIDHGTRFLVATHVSKERERADVVAFLRSYPWPRTQKPKTITTDGLLTYPRGISKVFWAMKLSRRTIHRRFVGLDAKKGNTNRVERIHGSLKDRTRSMRGLKKMNTVVLKAWPIHYNYLRPHQSLNGRTPAEAAGIHLPFEDGWGDLMRWATTFQAKNDSKGEDCTEIVLVPEN